jgi:hypothetical protein
LLCPFDPCRRPLRFRPDCRRHSNLSASPGGNPSKFDAQIGPALVLLEARSRSSRMQGAEAITIPSSNTRTDADACRPFIMFVFGDGRSHGRSRRRWSPPSPQVKIGNTR